MNIGVVLEHRTRLFKQFERFTIPDSVVDFGHQVDVRAKLLIERVNRSNCLNDSALTSLNVDSVLIVLRNSESRT